LGAQLKEAGVKSADATENTPAHGLTAPKRADKQEQVIGG
jgi:hypothetical protein